ncbi:MAG TPA: O-antigen ligase family protein [Gemmatimonadaceae bacterium]|nr:O-antigen ligase family protein [Gemmatimonadaceae bacterium]
MAARAIKLLLQIGAIAIVTAALPYKLFELDRYFVPKELVLHVTALIVGALLLARRRTKQFDLIDKLIAVFLVWSFISALFATNYWLAQRALGLSISSAIVFWGARAVAQDESYRGVLAGCAIATVLVSATCLAQTYGVETEYFSANRAPGGTLGNRNFVAHIAVIGLPSLLWCTVTARRSPQTLAGSFGVAVVAAALVLSRSRAAWLAVAASAALLFLPMLASRKYWSGAQIGGRFARLMLAAVIGAIIAIVMPNSLNWNSESPYLDSARAMVDYKKGSGRGRVAQYENSLHMSVRHPIFGVGPGNWPVEYVLFAPGNDRSLTVEGTTANPWPSSDWVGFMSERGFVPAVAMLSVFGVLFFSSLRRWRELEDGDAVLAQLVQAGTIVSTIVVSAFDVALLLAAPALLVWSVLGATSGIRRTTVGEAVATQKTWSLGVIGAMLILTASVIRSTTQTISMATVGRGGRTAGWVAGSAWDPGSYRINLKVAQFYARRGRCGTVRVYARRASHLFPHAREPKRLADSCG